ncbi:MAG: hypothetical protein A2857_02590 [Candidatus Levybacteria bacterium RIFCSPHIGHO2_01_FULL_36_15]|nr:MAG: hypothetical protein A2857_02590 [Candidatus Levybacteria bacterium RIFCSPHIGHO2_01_FULL_36_15]OGH38875.1 MAG: hypothetical protein A2905_04305 [Candidatus Levybacteria bacterium RIFCSPLOWO2_01_FULL_36_10]
MRRVSDILREEREKKNLSLEYIEKTTKIRVEYLKAIEEGRFHTLPSESYALGFVKNYASFLGLSRARIVALFRREYKEENREIIPNFRKNTNRFSKNPFRNSKNILITAIFLIVAVYIFFQYNSLLFGPPLSVSSPKNGETIHNNVVEIKGKTDPYAVLSIDGEEIFVGIDGSFKKSIYVFPGNKKISIVAKNRFGKETKQNFEVKVE